ncbi:MAG TPA: PAS domain-containing protein [Opitutaceae bacterium]|nr:PAS domain-containing protein [Opitutaceae bacterium]
MKKSNLKPTGAAQPFEVNETFFSMTDRRGVITAGNRVFSRVSGYSLEEMIGQPHNLVRHPGMPRLVFQRLWETIKAGKPFMGYVQNLTRTGNHYWVFAIVVPLPDGYLSVRFKPTSRLLAQVEDLYRQMIAQEEAAIERGESEAKAALVSAPLLEAKLRALGHASYDAFSHAALNTEIKSRDADIARRGLRLFPERIGTDSNQRLRDVYDRTLGAYAGLNTLFADLDAFGASAEGIRRHHAVVRSIVEGLRLNALNAHIAVEPLGQAAVTIGTVAQFLAGYASNLATNIATLTGKIETTSTAITEVASSVSSARVQLEMFLSFVAEIAAEDRDPAARRTVQALARSLLDAFAGTLRHATRAVESLRITLPALKGHREELRRDIVSLQVAQVAGLTECARLNGAENLRETFTSLREQIETGKRELDELGDVVALLTALSASTPPKIAQIETAIERVPEDLSRETEMPAPVVTADVASATNAAPPAAVERPLRVPAGLRLPELVFA